MANPTTMPIMTPASGPGNPLANPIYLVDQYGNPLTGSGGFNLAQVNGNPVATPNGSNQANATQMMNLGLYGGGATVAPMRDFTAVGGPDAIGQGVIPSVQAGWVGGGTVDFVRIPTIFKEVKAQAITAGTPVAVWAPTTGKKFHVLGYWLSTTVAGAILFEDTTGGSNEFWRTPLLVASAPFAPPILPRGYLSTAANNVLFLDVTVTGNVSGVIFGLEE